MPEVDGIEADDAVDATAARAELSRLFADPDFQCSDRNKRFLGYVADKSLAGESQAVKAYAIAVDVFGRPETFDPSVDPIVRIEATRLRASLTRYYELHGRRTAVRINLPPGRYVPEFVWTGKSGDSLAEPERAIDRSAQPANATLQRSILVSFLAGFGGGLTALFLFSAATVSGAVTEQAEVAVSSIAASPLRYGGALPGDDSAPPAGQLSGPDTDDESSTQLKLPETDDGRSREEASGEKYSRCRTFLSFGAYRAESLLTTARRIPEFEICPDAGG